ncbi:MAG: hypothetical protein A2511_15295 [Deltaproteobacteria bacterium RIFOXYD12_FULL_50_9]|nr:MAG: hypothetical protein A2511_15295 [Deltaproteobacteria bacterium RIFOXYD12_FULL_50_9]
MKQACHTWIALRALGLIQDDPKTQDLAQILVPWAKHSYIGCWLPDMQKFKKGHGIIGNHTFKNAPYNGDNKSRFVVPKQKLLDALDPNLALHGYISSNSTLDASWWKQPYKAEQKDGEHLPDCLSSLFDTIADLLLLGDPELDALVPGSTGYGDYLDPTCTLTKAQVSTFFFIMSHYIADCFMPCHADKRRLAAFETDGVHEGWEKHWEKLIGADFKKTALKSTPATSEQVVAKAKELDTTLGLTFITPLTWPDNDNDIWETAIFWCRASFAFSCNIFPIGKYPYDSQAQPLFNEHFSDTAKLSEYDRIVLQSAVYAVASTWKQIWRKFKE